MEYYIVGTSDGDYDEEIEIMLQGLDAEAWSVTVDKKTLKKMSAKDIKRQDHIWGRIYCISVTFHFLIEGDIGNGQQTMDHLILATFPRKPNF